MRRQFKRILGLCLLILGFSSIFTQIYFVREFLDLFHGNEIVIGIVFSSWMLLTGLGAWLGRFFNRIKGRLGFIFFLQIIFTILPLLTILKIDLWRSFLFPSGITASFTQILYSVFLLQLPFCLVNGFLFVAYTSMLSGYSNENRSGQAYSMESLGSVIGGMVVNLILLWHLDNFHSLLILITLNFIAVSIYISILHRVWQKGLLVILMMAINLIFIKFDLLKFVEQKLFSEQQVVYHQSSPYGTVVVTKNDGQFNFYENGLMAFSSGNEIFNEEAVHFAMIQHPDPRHVLLVSGGISGIAEEIMKYHPVEIDYFELNPAVTEIGLNMNKILSDPIVKIHNEDARGYLKRED